MNRKPVIEVRPRPRRGAGVLGWRALAQIAAALDNRTVGKREARRLEENARAEDEHEAVNLTTKRAKIGCTAEEM